MKLKFLESILAFSLKQFFVNSHHSLAEEWLFFVFLIKTEVVVAVVVVVVEVILVVKLGLTKKRIIFLNLFHESFPILIFEGSLSIKIAL